MTRAEFIQRTRDHAAVMEQKLTENPTAGPISANATIIAVMLQLVGEQLCDVEAAIRAGKVVTP